VKKGEALGIIGHNGAGKSTLLKILSRVTGPSKGSIQFNGRIASMLEVGTGFHPELTGRENIYMNGAILGMSKSEIDKKFDEIVEFAEIAKFIDTPVKRYSSGMYVKLAFSVAAHLDSEIMIMDEVLAVGDVNFQDKCLSKMGFEAAKGKTVLYVSHNMNTIKRLCQRCLVLKKGQIMFDGSKEELFKDSDLIDRCDLNYPSIINIMKSLKKKLRLDLDIYKYNIEDAFKEILKAKGEGHE
jgi:ABC-type polysaccharide/polyol phosphate transport system ATPase subunit